MILDRCAQADLFDFSDVLILFRVLFFLLLLVTILSVIKYLAYRRSRVRRDIDQVKICRFSHAKSFVDTDNAYHFAVFVDKTDFRCSDFFIDLCLFVVLSLNRFYF